MRSQPCPPRHLAGETLGGDELRCFLAASEASRDRDPAGTDAAKSGGAAFICYGCLKEMFDGADNREAIRQEWEVD